MILLDSAFAHVSEVSVLMFVCVCMNTHEGDKTNKLQCKTGYKHQESKLSPVPICAYGTVNGQTELASMSL